VSYLLPQITKKGGQNEKKKEKKEKKKGRERESEREREGVKDVCVSCLSLGFHTSASPMGFTLFFLSVKGK